MFPQVSRAGEWFLRSGIQTPEGGVARYYRSDRAANHTVSTEITGYFVSALVYLHELTGRDEYLDRARSAACFLTRLWDTSRAMPFEIAPPAFSYFFDCGIVVRGLLSAWRRTGEASLLDCARAIGDSMAHDFPGPEGRFHPILALPAKRPVEWEARRWSRSPGCYQLKAGMAWWDLFEATGAIRYRTSYEALLHDALRRAPDFLTGAMERRQLVDRLHAYLYYLEGLLPVAHNDGWARALCQGIQRVESCLRESAADFERSDVYAQLLRLRVFAAQGALVPLDETAARWEAARLQEFAITAEDPRMDGGFYFGRCGASWEPYVNPVSAAFALQALALWQGDAEPQRQFLI